MNGLPFAKLPTLNAATPKKLPFANSAPPPPTQGAEGTDLLRNTNPLQMKYRRFVRQRSEWLNQKAALPLELRRELEGYGDWYLRQYLDLQKQNAGVTLAEGQVSPQEHFLNWIRKQVAERNTKWGEIYPKLDANTQNSFQRWEKPFQEAYMDALIAGKENVVLNVDGKDVAMRGFDAAREIYRRALAWQQQQRMIQQRNAQRQLQKNDVYRVLVGGY